VTLLDSYFPFDTGSGTTATPARWRLMARLFYGSGVVPGNQNQLSCTIAGSVVTINTGAAWIDGFYGENDATKTVSVTGAGMIVARMDPNGRTITFVFVASQTVPTQTPTGIYEIPLYSVSAGLALTDIRQFARATPTAAVQARAYRNAAWTANTAERVPYDTLSFGSGFSLPSGIYTCPYAGTYLITGQYSSVATAVGQYTYAHLTHNGGFTGVGNGVANYATAVGQQLASNVTDLVPCSTGDTLSITVASNVNGLVGVTGQWTYMAVRLLQ